MTDHRLLWERTHDELATLEYHTRLNRPFQLDNSMKTLTLQIDFLGDEGEKMSKLLIGTMCEKIEEKGFRVTAAAAHSDITPFAASEIIDRVDNGEITDIYELQDIIEEARIK